MKILPDVDSTLLVGVFLLTTAFLVLMFLIWFTKPVRQSQRNIERRMDDVEAKLMGMRAQRYYMQGMDELEVELHHQRRRNSNKQKRK